MTPLPTIFQLPGRLAVFLIALAAIQGTAYAAPPSAVDPAIVVRCVVPLDPEASADAATAAASLQDGQGCAPCATLDSDVVEFEDEDDASEAPPDIHALTSTPLHLVAIGSATEVHLGAEPVVGWVSRRAPTGRPRGPPA